MRWPIRNQILIPFVTIQVVTLCLIAATTSWLAVQRVEREIQNRLAHVVSTLSETSFPFTSAVLERLHFLSGADFVVLNSEGEAIESTLDHTLTADWKQMKTRWSTAYQDWIELNQELFFTGLIHGRGPMQDRTVVVLYAQADWEAARREAMLPPLWIGTGLIIVTISLSVYLSRRLGQRLQSVQTQVQQIANGDFTPLQLPATQDELRDLAEAVNRMAVMLEESLEKVRETERSTLLTQLVGGLAHQLRNAITGARISVQLHQRRCESKEDEALKVALQQLTLIEAQIKSLLRVARGETRSKVRGSISEVLDGTLSLIQPICQHHKIQLEIHTRPTDRSIPDADAMRAALLNLMMNAVEAVGLEGIIRVEMTLEPHQTLLTISDNGPGLSSEEACFRPFFSTKKEGVGLGLSLALQAVEDCSGRLTVQRLNEFTQFQIKLPWPESD